MYLQPVEFPGFVWVISSGVEVCRDFLLFRSEWRVARAENPIEKQGGF